MDLNRKEYHLYKNIDFVKRYEKLSNTYQFRDTFENYSNEEILKLIAELGYHAKFIRSNTFFKIEEKIIDIKFYLHINLKYGNVELVIGSTKISEDRFIAGDVFRRIHKLVSYEAGSEIKETIRDPKFRSYADLREILKEALSIYEDFKKAVTDQEIL